MTLILVLFLFPLAYSPGPGNMFFAANGARFGFAKTLESNAGYHVATWVVTLAIGFGFNWIATASPSFLQIIKYAGSAYVFYLAWCLFRAGIIGADSEPRHAGFFDGVVLLLLNPKAYLIIMLMFAQFIGTETADQIGLVFWISTVFTINNLIAFSLWALVGDKLAAMFRQEARARRQNILFGGILAAVAVWMLLV